MLLARDGHDVCLLEADPTPVPTTPEDAWSGWERKGVAQFRQPHFLQSRVREVLERELPDTVDRLRAVGAARVDPLDRLPSAIEDRDRRDGDERFVSVTARRPTMELVFAAMAEEERRLDIRRGVGVAGLVTRTSGNGVPQVCGVRTGAGEGVSATLVVDAMGRSSRLPAWLRAVGAHALHEEAEDSGFLYYTRFFRSRNGAAPEPRTPGLLTPVGSFSILTLPSDRDTWCVTLFASSGDSLLKRLKDPEKWAAVVAACPLHAHWLEGEPISEVLPMGGVLDRYRRLVVDGRPAATGLALVADAWASTNPSLARGLALGLAHAARLRDVVRQHLRDPIGLARAWDAVTEAEFTPWYRATVAVDRARLAEIHALRDGREPTPPADRASLLRDRLPRAASLDADLFRAFMEIVGCLTLPADVLSRPGVADRVLELTEAADGRRPPPGPTRAELVELLG